MKIFELRSRDRSLIIFSQMEIGEWHKKLGGVAIADAILDRAISNSYHLYISGDSLRMKTGSAGSDYSGSTKRDLPGSGNRVFMVFLERYIQKMDLKCKIIVLEGVFTSKIGTMNGSKLSIREALH